MCMACCSVPVVLFLVALEWVHDFRFPLLKLLSKQSKVSIRPRKYNYTLVWMQTMLLVATQHGPDCKSSV